MAMQLDAGKVTRQDMFLIDPDNVIVDLKKRRRIILPTEKDVQSLAKSILDEGQLQPSKARRLPNKTVELLFGFTRWQAVKWINDNGVSLDNEKKLVVSGEPRSEESRLKLKVTLTECNDEEAFRQNIVENRVRKSTTAVDDAHNHRSLREELGYTDAQIADLYECSVAWVGQVRKLLSLPAEVQKKIGTEMSTTAALQLCDLSPAEQQQVLSIAQQTGTSVKVAEVKKAKRASATATGDASRSVKELKNFWEGLTGPAEDEAVRNFARSALHHIAGKISDKAMENAIHRLSHAAHAE